MSPVAIFLKEETNPDLRTIAYDETYKKEKVVFVKQELPDKEWITINHMALPIVSLTTSNPSNLEKRWWKEHSTRLIMLPAT